MAKIDFNPETIKTWSFRSRTSRDILWESEYIINYFIFTSPAPTSNCSSTVCHFNPFFPSVWSARNFSTWRPLISARLANSIIFGAKEIPWTAAANGSCLWVEHWGRFVLEVSWGCLLNFRLLTSVPYPSGFFGFFESCYNLQLPKAYERFWCTRTRTVEMSWFFCSLQDSPLLQNTNPGMHASFLDIEHIWKPWYEKYDIRTEKPSNCAMSLWLDIWDLLAKIAVHISIGMLFRP